MKFFTKRAVKIDAVAKSFRPLWRTRQSFNIRDIGNNHLVFAFEIEADVEKVLLGAGPWSFNRHRDTLLSFKGRQVTFEDGSEGWIAFKYERLPNLCYWCGRLSHDDKDCIFWLQIPALPNNQVILQNDSIGSTLLIIQDDYAGSRRNREQLLVVEPMVDVLSGGCQDKTNVDLDTNAELDKSKVDKVSSECGNYEWGYFV
ncbi:hypothetical protein SO802_020322 [Lithocarpus litseifolius]|uniref:Zinc knuckle CX2CX4HX4C domain-containing protein n=1 Tax=Lithocarpus litseifolius TaxID=425828 RepID=A0AAW2CCS7_9ROSI